MAGFRRFLTIVVVGGVLVVVAMMIFAPGSQRQRNAGRSGNPEGPIPVLAAEARIADVPVYLDGVGTTRALNMVTVHSQVDGTLVSVNFREGQDVKAGDVLARIDPTTYQAQLDQALAKKALDEAQLANARLDLERYTNLLKTNAVNRQQVDTTRALVAQLEAQVRLDQGAIDNARAYVNYCTIVAPISARVGIRLVDQGNLVHASDPTGIAMLTQIRPISVLFTLPQQQLGQVNKAFAKAPLSAEATESDSTVSVRPVGVTQQDEAQAVIANGLQAKDRVVTSGFAQLADGRKVTVSGATGATGAALSSGNPDDTGASQPRRQRGAGKSEASGAAPGTTP